MNDSNASAPATDSTPSTAPSPDATARAALRKGVLVLLALAPVMLLLILFVDRPVADAWEYSEPGFAYRLLDATDELGHATWYLIPGPILALALYIARSDKWRTPAYIASSVAVSGIAVNLLKPFFGRTRPIKLHGDGEYAFEFFRLGYSYNSFPSGHTTTAFAVAVALGILMPRLRYLWWAIGALVALGRVATNSHFVSDVVAGAWLGATTALALSAYFIPKSPDTKTSHPSE